MFLDLSLGDGTPEPGSGQVPGLGYSVVEYTTTQYITWGPCSLRMNSSGSSLNCSLRLEACSVWPSVRKNLSMVSSASTGWEVTMVSHRTRARRRSSMKSLEGRVVVVGERKAVDVGRAVAAV